MTRPSRAALVTFGASVAVAALIAGAVVVAVALGTGTRRVGDPSLAAGATAPAVLAPTRTAGVAPTTAGVQRALAAALKDPSLGAHRGAYVYDASRDRLVYSVGTARPYAPASTMKLLTTVSALATLGPDHWFTTKTVSVNSGTIVLVGGGDPLLTVKRPTDPLAFPQRASLQDLAAGTARALRAQGIRSVKLGYDASLFTGPAANAKWLPKYVAEGIAARTSALWVDEARLRPGLARRAASPALAAATAFAQQLRAAGLVVAAPRPMSAPATGGALAQVRSAPLGQIVEHINMHSDNDAAEVLLRHVGLATDQGGSYADGLEGVRSTLTGLGLDVGQARLEDGSGLSRTSLVPLDLLAGAVRVAASPGRPELRPLLTGLPVAGFNGSLEDRFSGAALATGGGLVRAKTGTLTGVHSLAGLVRDRTGTLLVFALATDSAAPDKPLEARAALDRAASALAGCGCG